MNKVDELALRSGASIKYQSSRFSALIFSLYFVWHLWKKKKNFAIKILPD